MNRKCELHSTNDVHARAIGKSDGKCVELGDYDVKVNSGAVCYGNGLTKADCIADNVFSNFDSIVFYPDLHVSRDVSPLIIFRMGFVFSRGQFIAMLEYAGKKGLQSMLKISKNGGQINLQNINPVPFGKMLDFIEQNNIPSVYEWGEQHNRKWIE